MQCQQHWVVPTIVSLVVLVLAESGPAQAAADPEHVSQAPELVQTDERTQMAVLRAGEGPPYVVRVGEIDAVTGLVLRQVGASTVIFEGAGTAGGAGLRLRIETDGLRSQVTWSSEQAPAELLRTTPVWTLLEPLDAVVELPEGDR